MNRRTIIAFLSLALAVPNLALAQTEPVPETQAVPDRFVYEWTDDNGVIHLTDDPGKVPPKYRSKSLKKRAEPRPEENRGKPENRAVRPAARSAVSRDQEREQQQRMDAWRHRFFEWKDKLRQSEERYQSLQQRRTDLIAPWGSLSLAPPPVVEEFGQVEKALKNTQTEIDEARHMVEEVLPDEARKAGVPPGWLRE